MSESPDQEKLPTLQELAEKTQLQLPETTGFYTEWFGKVNVEYAANYGLTEIRPSGGYEMPQAGLISIVKTPGLFFQYTAHRRYDATNEKYAEIEERFKALGGTTRLLDEPGMDVLRDLGFGGRTTSPKEAGRKSTRHTVFYPPTDVFMRRAQEARARLDVTFEEAFIVDPSSLVKKLGAETILLTDATEAIPWYAFPPEIIKGLCEVAYRVDQHEDRQKRSAACVKYANILASYISIKGVWNIVNDGKANSPEVEMLHRLTRLEPADIVKAVQTRVAGAPPE
jgi:hypothetical protein